MEATDVTGWGIDWRASLARTALSDPEGLSPEDWDTMAPMMRGEPAQVDRGQVTYALCQLDEIEEVLNPSEETRVTMARGLTMLGRHLAEFQGTMARLALDAIGSDAHAYTSAAYLTELAGDRIDEALGDLYGTSTDEDDE